MSKKSREMLERYARGQCDGVPVNGLPWDMAMSLLRDLKRAEQGDAIERAAAVKYLRTVLGWEKAVIDAIEKGEHHK